MTTQDPWVTTPTELIRHAIYHLHQATEFDYMVAYLLSDVGMELVLKTYLLSPKEKTGVKLDYRDRKMAAGKRFHELVIEVKKAAAKRLDGVDLTHIKYYHGLRNKLYHQGNGITISEKKVRYYTTIAVDVLHKLLGVNLQPELIRPQKELSERQKNEKIYEKIKQVRNEVKQILHEIEKNLYIAIATVEKTFVYPSFESIFMQWQGQLEKVRVAYIKGLYDNQYVKKDEKTGLRVCSHKLISEIKQMMPNNVRQFVNQYNVDPWTISMSADESVENFLLSVADYVFKLPTAPSTQSYMSAKIFLLQTDNISCIFDHFCEKDSPLEFALQDGKDDMKNIIKLRDVIISVIENNLGNSTQNDKINKT